MAWSEVFSRNCITAFRLSIPMSTLGETSAHRLSSDLLDADRYGGDEVVAGEGTPYIASVPWGRGYVSS